MQEGGRKERRGEVEMGGGRKKSEREGSEEAIWKGRMEGRKRMKEGGEEFIKGQETRGNRK